MVFLMVHSTMEYSKANIYTYIGYNFNITEQEDSKCSLHLIYLFAFAGNSQMSDVSQLETLIIADLVQQRHTYIPECKILNSKISKQNNFNDYADQVIIYHLWLSG